MFFPSQNEDDGAARLRAFNIAAELTAIGWRAATCPKQLGLAARRRLVRLFAPDVIVMQTARHPLNRPALFPGARVVVDLDDADYLDPTSAAPLIAALRASAGVIAGSRAVAAFCRRHNDRVAIVWTGTPPSPGTPAPQAGRGPVVTWAASAVTGSHGERRFLRHVLEALAARRSDAVFRTYGDDGSAAYRSAVAEMVPAGITLETMPYLYYPDFLASLDGVAVGLAPLVGLDGFSGGKSFGKVLAYVDRNVPVVTHAAVDHPLFFRHGDNGLLLDAPEEWAVAIDRLLDDAVERERLADAAHRDFVRRLSTATAARLVDRFLRRVIAARD